MYADNSFSVRHLKKKSFSESFDVWQQLWGDYQIEWQHRTKFPGSCRAGRYGSEVQSNHSARDPMWAILIKTTTFCIVDRACYLQIENIDWKYLAFSVYRDAVIYWSVICRNKAGLLIYWLCTNNILCRKWPLPRWLNWNPG